MQSIHSAFETDKLGVLILLSQVDWRKEEFSTRDSFMHQLGDLGDNIGWIVSAIIGMIGAVISIITVIVTKPTVTGG